VVKGEFVDSGVMQALGDNPPTIGNLADELRNFLRIFVDESASQSFGRDQRSSILDALAAGA
jgi:hypothetical protein